MFRFEPFLLKWGSKGLCRICDIVPIASAISQLAVVFFFLDMSEHSLGYDLEPDVHQEACRSESTFVLNGDPEDDYHIETAILGSGSNATVHYAKWRHCDKPCPNGDDAKVVVFKIQIPQKTESQKESDAQDKASGASTEDINWATFCDEVTKLAHVQHHPNIVRFLDALPWKPCSSL